MTIGRWKIPIVAKETRYNKILEKQPSAGHISARRNLF